MEEAVTYGRSRAMVWAEGVTKVYGHTTANDSVTFGIMPGEIHALLGENGAGKTTLSGVLFGAVQPDLGTIRVNGAELKLKSPRDALDLGIAMVYQHFMLVPELSVAENVVMGSRPATLRHLSRREVHRSVAAAADEAGIEIPVASRVATLPVDVQQKVEILRCLYRGARALILDEPTAVLGPIEIENLFKTLMTLRDSGRGIVIVTHKINEVMAVADRATILRHGRVASSLTRTEFSEDVLTREMVQGSIPPARTRARVGKLPRTDDQHRDMKMLLRLDGVSTSSLGTQDGIGLDDVSLDIQASEVVGLAGVEGNGQGELVQLLAGVLTASAGSIELDGVDVTGAGPANRRRAGLVVIPEDRHADGVIEDLTVADNLALSRIADGVPVRFGLLRRKEILDEADRLIAAFDIRPRDARAKVRHLSGGNQQKVVLARAISAAPTVLVAAHPTRGLDLGATAFVHRELEQIALEGRGVLVVSSDLDELFALSDRVLVLYRGRITMNLTREAFSAERVARAMAGFDEVLA